MAPSELAWLDFSEAEQRRAREAVQLFVQRDSRDELGTGVLRDIISERLFPGISVLHQRARYFLFIPWIFVSGAQSRTGRKLLDFVDVDPGRQPNLFALERPVAHDWRAGVVRAGSRQVQ